MCTLKASDYKTRCDTVFANDASRIKTQNTRMYKCQRCSAYKTFYDFKKEPCTKRPKRMGYNACHAALPKARNHVTAIGLTGPIRGKRKATAE